MTGIFYYISKTRLIKRRSVSLIRLHNHRGRTIHAHASLHVTISYGYSSWRFSWILSYINYFTPTISIAIPAAWGSYRSTALRIRVAAAPAPLDIITRPYGLEGRLTNCQTAREHLIFSSTISVFHLFYTEAIRKFQAAQVGAIKGCVFITTNPRNLRSKTPAGTP